MNRCSKFVAMSIVALMIISTIAAIPLLNVSASNDTNATYTGDPITLVKGTPEKSYESFGLYWDPDIPKLTLNGFKMEHSGTDADVRTIGIGWVDPKQTDVCEVEIIGNNSIKSTINSTTGSMNVYGITCDSSIHLYGSGKLDINLSLSTTATDSNAQIYGIYTSYSMSIDGCDVTVTINDMLNDGYIGASALFATVLSIEDSVVKLKIGNMTSNANIRLSCIMTFTLVNIYNSTLEASTGKVTTSGDEKVSCGIDTPNIVAKNSTVKSEGYTSAFSYVPYELITDGSLKILGGKEIGKNPTKTITKDEMADYNVVKITCSGSSSESGVTIDVVVLAISLIMIVAIISTLWIVFRRP